MRSNLEELSNLARSSKDLMGQEKVLADLAELKSEEAAYIIIDALEENDDLLLMNYGDAKKALLLIGSEALDVLRQASYSQNSNVKSFALETLSALDANKNFSIFATNLRENDKLSRLKAMEGLQQISDLQAAEVLAQHLGRGEPDEDHRVIWALGGMGDLGVPFLKDAFSHNYPWISEGLLEALNQIGTEKAQQAIASLPNKSEVPCSNCKVIPQSFIYPNTKRILKTGKAGGWFSSWDQTSKCHFCGTVTGIKLGNK